MTVQLLLQHLIFGILTGALYGLAAAGLSLVFGVLRVLNVAHGELIMLGGYATFWMAVRAGLDPFVSLAVVTPLMFAVGLGLHQALFVHVERLEEDHRIRQSLLLSFGLALVLYNVALRLWTADDRSVTTAYAGAGLALGGLVFPWVRVGALAVGLVAIGGLHLLLGRTTPGRAIRAVSQDWQAAVLAGIDPRRVYLLAFAIGSALAGVAGTLLIAGYSINPGIGLEWTLKALIVIVLAGLGSMPGTFLGGLLLGAAEGVSVVFLGGAYQELVGLAIFLGVLMLRPEGLFGQ